MFNEATEYAKQQAELIKQQQQYQLEQQRLAEQERLKALELAKQESLKQTAAEKLAQEQAAKQKQQEEYLQRQLNQQTLNQQLARAGLGTQGVRESTLSDLYANYGKNINTINANTRQALKDIGLQESNIESQYGQNVAAVKSEEALKRAEIQQYIDQLALERYNQAYQNYIAQKQYEEQMRLAELERQEEQRRYEQEMALQRAAARRSSSGGSSSGGSSSNYNFNEQTSNTPTFSNQIASDYAKATQAQIERYGRNATEGEIVIAAKSLAQRGVPTNEILKYGAMFGYDLSKYLK